MKLTFEEAIENHRKMWNWIADETEKREEIVIKQDYFRENEIDPCIYNCYCCQYAKDNSAHGYRDCKICPIIWRGEFNNYYQIRCTALISLYELWHNADNWQSAAKYARQIANLPERREVYFKDKKYERL